MASVDRTARDGRAAQVLAVLALLLGLLAMHGLVADHSSSGAVQGPTSATAPGLQQRLGAALGLADPTPPGQHHGAAMHVLAHPAGLTAALAPAGRPDAGALHSPCTDCPDHGAVALCLAVLVAVVARLLAHRARAAPSAAPQVRLPLLGAGPLPFPRPPDLVAGLCVSRT